MYQIRMDRTISEAEDQYKTIKYTVLVDIVKKNNEFQHHKVILSTYQQKIIGTKKKVCV